VTTEDLTHAEEASAESDADRPLVNPRKEVRLALVMYGGVSLAIYINGVVQEIFHLVRATALQERPNGQPQPALLSAEELTDTERVYRDLARLIPTAQAEPVTRLADVREDSEISTQFVVDVLSGTSAGGINAIFLAKALANDQKIEEVKRLWMDEGDISVLLNDAHSRVKGLTQEDPPASLLNSSRMYWKLLEAFEGMEPQGEASRSRPVCRSPYVQELDLYVTATDLRGVKLPLALSNGVAIERRYRNVFHFVYGTSEATGEDRNDFPASNNPMLAFVARCTSAFPLAFQPMEFGDMAQALRKSEYFRGVDLNAHPWQHFYHSYFLAHGEPGSDPESGPPTDITPEQDLPFNQRPFGDGGALDNKPFTYATSTLLRRRADFLVDRKLVYIEPDPGHPEYESTSQDRPNALANFEIQGISLPRQETVRDDLEAVRERNRVIQRVQRVLLEVDRDVGVADENQEKEGGTLGRRTGSDWAQEDLADEIARRGVGYGGYHRLKVATVTDDISELVASLAGFDDDSDLLLAVRYLVRAWRDASYDHYRGSKPKTFNSFLLDYDLSHRLRRLNFLRQKVDELHEMTDDTVRAMTRFDQSAADAAIADKASFRRALLDLKWELSNVFVRLRYLGRRLRRPMSEPLFTSIQQTDISAELLVSILEPADEGERRRRAEQAYMANKASLEAFAAELANSLRNGVAELMDRATPPPAPYGAVAAANDLARILQPPEGADAADAAAPRFLHSYYEAFDDYDMVAFPILFASEAGETDPVEIIRISPEDAPSLVDERASGFEKRKVRGFKYGHFGAFLDRSWRANDMLFGRLDGAECLINALLPEGHPDRRTLLRRAQAAIILEELSAQQRREILGDPLPADPDAIVDAFVKGYHVSDQIPPRSALPNASRGANVIGKMMSGIAGERGAFKRPIGWVARGASLFAGLVSVSLPDSAPNLVFLHLVPLLIGFEVFMIVLGLVFRSPAVTHLGVLALVLTALVGVMVQILTGIMRERNWVKAVGFLFAILIGLAVVALVLAEIGHASGHLGQYWHDLKAFFHHPPKAATPAGSG
jgi:patatin-related protein